MKSLILLNQPTMNIGKISFKPLQHFQIDTYESVLLRHSLKFVIVLIVLLSTRTISSRMRGRDMPLLGPVHNNLEPNVQIFLLRRNM